MSTTLDAGIRVAPSPSLRSLSRLPLNGIIVTQPMRALVFIIIGAATTIGFQALRAGVADAEGISLWDWRWKRPTTEAGRRNRKAALLWLAVGICALAAWALFGIAQIQRRW